MARMTRHANHTFDIVLYSVLALWAGSLLLLGLLFRSGLVPSDSFFGVAVVGASVLALLTWASLLSRVTFKKA